MSWSGRQAPVPGGVTVMVALSWSRSHRTDVTYGIREALGKLAADPEKYAPADAFDCTKDELDGFGVLHSGHDKASDYFL